MSTDKFTLCTEDPAGKRGAGRKAETQTRKHAMNCGTTRILTVCLIAAAAMAQNPPENGDPYVSRGNPTSPNGKYTWIVRTDNPIRYELVDTSNGKALAVVKASYPETDILNIQYAKANGVFWNSAGTVVALDELNRRRAGHLYFFTLRNGTVHEIASESIIPIPESASEGRVVVDPGWVSPAKIRVRLGLKTKGGAFVSKYYLIDFADPDQPKLEPAT